MITSTATVNMSIKRMHLLWPSQAADWPTRHRNYDWPDSATVYHVVSNGCDMVPVAHRQCRQHEWMGKNQWRLSFSRAEIVLINSWMPLSQIVYHMLRYFVKIKGLIDSAVNYSERVVVSNYHIKTLMLWASETKPRSWWTDSLNVVRICVELLHTLAVCLTDTCCPHYFVNNCSLIDSSVGVGTVASELMSINEAYLSTWFVDNYIENCAQRCPDYVRRLFVDANNVARLKIAVTAINEFRVNTSLHDLCEAVSVGEHNISGVISRREQNVRSFVYLMNELTTRDARLFEYLSAVALLHVAYIITRNGFNENLMDILATTLGQFVDASRYSKRRSSVLL